MASIKTKIMFYSTGYQPKDRHTNWGRKGRTDKRRTYQYTLIFNEHQLIRAGARGKILSHYRDSTDRHVTFSA
jgi:hypothetical protein